MEIKYCFVNFSKCLISESWNIVRLSNSELKKYWADQWNAETSIYECHLTVLFEHGKVRQNICTVCNLYIMYKLQTANWHKLYSAYVRWSTAQHCLCMHPVRNSLWLKKNRASDNEGKFHSFLMWRIWIYSQKINFIIGHQHFSTGNNQLL